MNQVPPFTISPVLRAAAELRIEEFERVKSSFIQRYRIDQKYNSRAELLEAISKLLKKIELNDPELQNDDHDFDIENLTRFVELAGDDLSISKQKLLKIMDQVRNSLDKRLNRMDVASLHISLMRESMNMTNSSTPPVAASNHASSYDGFELVESEREDVIEQYKSDAYITIPVDTTAIEAFLCDMFEDPVDRQALTILRRDMESYAAELMADGLETDQDSLMWTIVDLLKNDLVDPNKKKVLEGYLQSPIALRELVATLNMKTYRQWNFRGSHDGLPIASRMNDDGQYCMVVDEDLIDMLFLHCTAMDWASKLKECLTRLVSHSTYFSSKLESPQEICKWEYYLGRHRRMKVKSRYTTCKICEPALVPPPPPPMPPMSSPRPPNIYGISELRPRPYDHAMLPPPPPPPPAGITILDMERQMIYKDKFFLSQLPTQEDGLPRLPCPKTVQAEMIKVLAAEARLRHAFDGSVHSLQLRISNLASSLPHQTVLCVLKFLGIPENFLFFFERVLAVPLRTTSRIPGQADKAVKRACGVAQGHRLGIFFSETVLSFLDLSVHRTAGAFLYRTQDQLNFVGTSRQTRLAGETMERFGSIMGLSLHPSQGSRGLAIGLLRLHNDTGLMQVDMRKVVGYAHRTKKKLDACTTVLDWIRTWNNTIGTYASHLFGPLADGLGHPHLDAVKTAYKRLCSILFDGGTLTTRVKHMLHSHIPAQPRTTATPDPADMLEAIMYMPQAHGGLGLKNPFITLQLGDKTMSDPRAAIQSYLDSESAYHEVAARQFAAMPAQLRQQKLEDVLNEHEECMAATLGNDGHVYAFPTLAELTARRESAVYPHLSFDGPLAYRHAAVKTPSLITLWRSLLNEPVHHIEDGARVSGYMAQCCDGERKTWRQLSGEDRWVLQMYSEECFEKYGTLNIWWADGVPTEVYKALRGQVWDQGEEEDSDDAVSDGG